MNVLHEDFFETVHKQVNLFLVGSGNVGGKLIEQLKQQIKHIDDQLHLNIRVIGIASSKKMLLNEDGIDLQDWKQKLQDSEPMTLNGFTDFFVQ